MHRPSLDQSNSRLASRASTSPRPAEAKLLKNPGSHAGRLQQGAQHPDRSLGKWSLTRIEEPAPAVGTWDRTSSRPGCHATVVGHGPTPFWTRSTVFSGPGQLLPDPQNTSQVSNIGDTTPQARVPLYALDKCGR